MNNKQVAHLWANQSRESARGSHFYFEGDTIYSYGSHFPIARHHKGAVLFTRDRYSNSTARHISITQMSCNHLATFHVVQVRDNPGAKDVNAYSLAIEQSELALARKRALDEFDLNCHERLVNEANQFCQHFGFKTRFSMPDDTALAAFKERAKQITAKKAKATAARNAKIEKENAEHGSSQVMIDTNKWGFAPMIGRKNHLGTRIPWSKLPTDCKKLVRQDYVKMWGLQ